MFCLEAMGLQTKGADRNSVPWLVTLFLTGTN